MYTRIFLLIAIAFISCTPKEQQSTAIESSPIVYKVSFDNVQHHELDIDLTINNISEGPLLLKMPQSSPGRYAVHNFAKNVYNVTAKSSTGEALAIYKTDIATWEVPEHNGSATITYTLFANHGDGTYSGIDNRKAHLNMPATFLYADGYEDRPIELNFELDQYPDWEIASQLERTKDKHVVTAPDYYYFYDSPTMVGPMKWRTWEVSQGEDTYIFEIAAMIEDSNEALDAYTEWVKLIVDEQALVFGGLPDFDFGRYTFLVSYNPWIFGDGMEHRNSTVCSSKGNLTQHAPNLIGTISHEFFHAWNVERIRPQSLEPFDFDRANMSELLWFSEGFTSYYGNLILKRVGIIDEAQFISGLQGNLNYVVNSPGRAIKGPAQMSMHAPFVDAATANDENNYANTYISYYSYGAAIGLILDLSLRSQYEGKTLDNVMQYMWSNYGATEQPITIPDLEQAVASVTGDPAFAADFFNDYIYGSKLPNLEPLFAHVGVNYAKQNADAAGFYGLRLVEEGGSLQVSRKMLKSNPLYNTGLESGDIIVAIDGKEVKSKADFDKDWEIGSTHTVEYVQNGLTMTGAFKVEEDITIALTTTAIITEQQTQAKLTWLD
jgi:predicted metalloprotease with PDZ domain